jgi:hypothetical protein
MRRQLVAATTPDARSVGQGRSAAHTPARLVDRIALYTQRRIKPPADHRQQVLAEAIPDAIDVAANKHGVGVWDSKAVEAVPEKADPSEDLRLLGTRLDTLPTIWLSRPSSLQ